MEKCRATWKRNGKRFSCSREAKARNLCSAHYKQRYDGRSFGPIEERRSADDRFGRGFPRKNRGK